MFNLKKRRPWVGSAVFVLSIAAIVFAFIYVPTATTAGVSATVRLACVSLGFAWAIEGIRQLKLHELRRNLDAADDRNMLKVFINDIEVGEIPETVYANMRIVSAHDPRNYFTQFIAIATAVAHHAYVSFVATVLLIAVCTLGEWLLFPHESAGTLVAIFSQPAAQSDRVAALASVIHAFASTIAWAFATGFMVTAGARMIAGASMSLVGAFREDLSRRIRLIVGSPVGGALTVSRARRV